MKNRLRIILCLGITVILLCSGIALGVKNVQIKPGKLKTVNKFSAAQQKIAAANAIKDTSFLTLSDNEKVEKTMKRLGFAIKEIKASTWWPNGWNVVVQGWIEVNVDPVFKGGISRINNSPYIWFPNNQPTLLVAPSTEIKGWFLWLDINIMRNKIGLKWVDSILNKHGVGVGPFVK